MNNTITSNNFFSICKAISNKAEEEIKEFDEHITFDEERQKVFLQGIMHAAATLGIIYLTGEPTEFVYDYNKFLALNKKYQEFTQKDEKAHQISMDEYLEEKNKEDHIESLAMQIAKIVCKEFKDNYKFTSKPADIPSFLKRKK